jgi:membrane protein implicated in regulation of membrane protease activity
VDWWIWIVLGLALLVLELATPGGFYFIFFGASALIVGLLTLMGFTSTPWMEWILFSVFTAGLITIFRDKLVKRFGPVMPEKDVDTLVGEVAMALEAILPGATGKAELRGSSWTACNSGSEKLSQGQRCRVERVDGLTLFIRAEAPSSPSH